MNLERGWEEGRVCVALHSIAVLDMGRVHPIHGVREDYFLAAGHIGDIHSFPGIHSDVGRNNLVVVVADAEVKVRVQIDSCTLDALAEQKLFVHNLWQHAQSVAARSSIKDTKSPRLPRPSSPTMAVHR